MRILVVDAFERGNRGDAALLSVLLRQGAQAYNGAELAIAGFENPQLWPEFDGVPNLGSIRRYVGEEDISRGRRVLRKLLTLAITLAATTRLSRRLLLAAAGMLPTEVRRELRAVAGADLVVALGGGYLNARDDFASDLSVFFLLLPLWLAQRFGVPVVAAPQSYGPFPRSRQRWMVRQVLSNAEVVVVREDISVRRLHEAGVDPGRLVRGVDSAFAFTSGSARRWRCELDVPTEATLVVVTARQWLAAEAQEGYEGALEAGIQHILGLPDHYVVLVPQVTCAFQEDDDRRVNARIVARIQHPRMRAITDDTFDHHEALALYAEADYIVGTRFHSVIFGLTAGVPCVAIEYDHKTRGIMRDLGLEDWVTGIAEVSPDSLVALIDRLFATRAEYVSRLKSRLPRYVADAHDITFIRTRTRPTTVDAHRAA
jgi:polysaccharide pyruvyl transferase WcaK-like protein